MSPNYARFEQWEREYIRSMPVDYRENMRLFEAMYEEAVALGVLPSHDPLEGIETIIRVARAFHVSDSARKDRSDKS